MAYISSEEIFRAYRKAKTESFYDTNCAHGLKFAEYEGDLISNLQRLRTRINRKGSLWFRDPEFVGNASFIPKSIATSPRGSEKRSQSHFECSNRNREWASSGESAYQAEFRPVTDSTVDYMVVSALWILKVGHIYDEALDSRLVFGSRLRRWRPDSETGKGNPGNLNLDSPSLFAPYYINYGIWRNRGLGAMKAALKRKERIVAITMDLKRFYHRVNPTFLLHPKYLSGLRRNLSPQDIQFTRNVIASFSTWNKELSRMYGGSHFGVPVGLTSSAVIANCLLRDFDIHVSNRLDPVYYGRYVDDVILVVRSEEEFSEEVAAENGASSLIRFETG